MFSDLDDWTAFGGGSSGADMARSGSNSTNLTISPSELMFGESLASAPNSGAITNLTSPSIYNTSPELLDNLNFSPFEGTDGVDGSNWFPLFPTESTSNPQPSLALEHSPVISDGIDIEEAASAHKRRKSSNNASPKGEGRHSSVSGVKPRKRDKPLPPIIVDDPNDQTKLKRARNTLAARKSRERKAQKMEEYEAAIARLEEERDYWRQEALSRGAPDVKQ